VQAVGRVLKLLIGYQKCSFLRAILARFNKFRTRPKGLPWHTPPFIGGFNQFTPKPETKILLEAVHFRAFLDPIGLPFFEEGERFPLLVVGKYGKGNVAALATDVAPHWVGGWVDWGEERVTQKTIGNEFIEAGADYVKFFAQLVQWCRATEKR